VAGPRERSIKEVDDEDGGDKRGVLYGSGQRDQAAVDARWLWQPPA
jgi:hypothetical protein